MTSDVVMSLRDVRKRYGSLEVVRGVDLDIRRGELAAIVGPSGSGKSTLLHVMGTLDRPTSGEVVVDGISTKGLSDADLAGLRARRIGFVFQSFHLMPGTSAVDNVATGLALLRRAPGRTAQASAGDPAPARDGSPAGSHTRAAVWW